LKARGRLDDLILLNNPTGYAVGEVTGIAPGNGTTTNVTFANGDPLNVNQSGAAKGNIKSIIAGGNPVATRIWAVTYFMEVPPVATSQPPRLMRQVNGQAPSPVAMLPMSAAISMTVAALYLITEP
jgi:hypothetical protein